MIKSNHQGADAIGSISIISIKKKKDDVDMYTLKQILPIKLHNFFFFGLSI